MMTRDLSQTFKEVDEVAACKGPEEEEEEEEEAATSQVIHGVHQVMLEEDSSPALVLSLLVVLSIVAHHSNRNNSYNNNNSSQLAWVRGLLLFSSNQAGIFSILVVSGSSVSPSFRLYMCVVVCKLHLRDLRCMSVLHLSHDNQSVNLKCCF
eukprot:m.5998 g.5998  ORF g.5998 m.5998 type:complete len:152 (+) comp14665_c0_seq1:111-566(+)